MKVTSHSQKIKFSIIIPVFNTEKFIKKTIYSVLNQTLNEFEIICINDGSSDNSLSLLYTLQHEDSRIIVINQKNQGQGHARNRGLSLAQGEYIFFLDSDDWIEEHCLEELYKKFIHNNLDIIYFEGHNFYIEENKFRQEKSQTCSWLPFKKEVYLKDDI